MASKCEICGEGACNCAAMVAKAAADPRGHILESYGECTAGRHCSCIRALGSAGWMGSECPLWKSWGCRTWEELRQKQLAVMRNGE